MLIDYDTGQPVTVSAKRFLTLKSALVDRRKELPALWMGARAITLAPGLAAVTLLGLLGVGALGTVLLLAGLIR